MDIVQVYSGQNSSTGDYIYRIKQPAQRLSSLDGINVVNFDLVSLKNLDLLLQVPLLILHHLSDPDLLPVISERRRIGKPTIYELSDNFRHSQDHDPKIRRQGPPEYYLIIEEMIRRCDAVQVNNYNLAKRYSHLNEKFIIVANFIDKCESKKSQKQKQLTIGWGGSKRHFDDLEYYSKTLAEWILAHPDVTLAIMGTRSIQEIFKDLPSQQLILKKPAGLREYLSFLKALDIGIAPLLPTEFNRCRSDMKFLEYASKQIVPLCSRFGPYIEVGKEWENTVLFDDPDEMAECLEKLYRDKELRNQIANNAFDWVRENRLSDERHWRKIVNLYKTLLLKHDNDYDHPYKLDDSMINEKGASLINLAMKSSNNEVRRERLKQAENSMHDHYQFHYFYACFHSQSGNYHDAIRYLQKTLEIVPDSIRTIQMLTQLYLIKGDVDSAQKAVERGLEIEPNLPTLLCLKANILQLKNQHANAFLILKKCVEKAPEFVDALTAHMHSALVLKKNSAAHKSALKLLDIIPESAEVHFYLGIIENLRRDKVAARKHLQTALDLEPEHPKSKRLLKKLQLDKKHFIHTKNEAVTLGT